MSILRVLFEVLTGFGLFCSEIKVGLNFFWIILYEYYYVYDIFESEFGILIICFL